MRYVIVLAKFFAFKIWLPKIGTLSHYDLCRAGIAVFCFWEIWVARYEASYEGRKMGTRRICLKAIPHVQFLSLAYSPSKLSGRIQNHILGIIGVQKKLVYFKRGVWCQWKRPL